jgi:hypothetical protein
LATIPLPRCLPSVALTVQTTRVCTARL